MGEESDNESDGRGKDKAIAEEEEEQQQPQQEQQQQQQHPEIGHISSVGLSPPAPIPEEKIQTPPTEDASSSCLPR